MTLINVVGCLIQPCSHSVALPCSYSHCLPPHMSCSAAPRLMPCCSLHNAPCCPARCALLQPARRALLQPARRALLPCTSRPVAASVSRPTAASALRPAALRVAPCCSQRVAPYCNQRVTLCCPARRALLQPARRTLLQPARRALLPCVSRPAAASASHPTAASTSRSAAPRVTPCCPAQRAPCCPVHRAPCPAARGAPCPAEPRPAATIAAVAARATATAGGGAAGSTGSAAGAGGAGGATGSAGGAAGAGGATGSAGGASGSAGGAAGAGAVAAARGGQWQSMPLPDSPTPQQLREWALQQARPGGGGFGFLHTAQRRQQSQQETFSPQVFSELFPQRCVTGFVEAAALGASESAAALGASESAAALGATESTAALGARASPITDPSSVEALHTFTLDSGASRCFFCDCTTLTPLAASVSVSLADPTGGPVVARASTVLPCPAVPFGSLSGLHLPTFSTNSGSNAAIQDVWVDTFIPGGQHVAICTLPPDSPLAPPPRSTLPTASPRYALPTPSFWPSQVPAPLPRSPALPCLPCECYFLLVVDDYTCYTTVFPLRHKADVSGVLIPWIRATRRQLRERFSRDFPVLRLHSDRGGEFSSDLLAEFCRDEGIQQSFTLLASPQQNGIADRCIGLIMEVARTSSGAATQRGGLGGSQRQQQLRTRETPSVQQLREWYAGRGRSGGAGPCAYVLRTGTRSGEVCGLPHTTQRCFGRLTDAWRTHFPHAVDLPHWHDLLLQNVPIFDLDFDAILAAMYALADITEGDCYLPSV
ncbi:unnamed protein product [Closterium sp. NIES-54]